MHAHLKTNWKREREYKNGVFLLSGCFLSINKRCPMCATTWIWSTGWRLQSIGWNLSVHLKVSALKRKSTVAFQQINTNRVDIFSWNWLFCCFSFVKSAKSQQYECDTNEMCILLKLYSMFGLRLNAFFSVLYGKCLLFSLLFTFVYSSFSISSTLITRCECVRVKSTI